MKSPIEIKMAKLKDLLDKNESTVSQNYELIILTALKDDFDDKADMYNIITALARSIETVQKTIEFHYT